MKKGDCDKRFLQNHWNKEIPRLWMRGGISFYLKEIISCYREISHNKER